jgi:mannitol-1-phosphate 5-dehydrogenase
MAPYDKKSVHFGGGNIGRGFVAEFLHNSGYEVVFIDVMDSIIDALQKSTQYTVTEIGEDGERTFDIDHYRAINSKYEEEKVVEEIATADTVTCAVGPNILKFIAPAIAKGIEARKLDYPLAVIACENAINATDTLRDFIFQKLSNPTKADIGKHARFANSAIDRIVPHQDPNAGLDVKIEKFYEWCVELQPFKGAKHPDIKGVHFVDNLEPYIERKLFTVNTGHATAAYYGKQRGKKLIHEALADKEIHDLVRDVLRETARLIVDKHKIDAQEQQDYVDKIVSRFSNPALEDKVERVGRAPLRKLSRKERFIGPAAQLAERKEPVDHLLGAIEQAFLFQNVEGDEESVELATMLAELDAKDVTIKVTGLEQSHPLFERILPIVEKVQAKNPPSKAV